ncbi:MAG: nucleoside recognition protein [Lachnospiraceae bacterium]|nr:nucleoside recognition protein [Lachnospiraceae bacterium]
MLNYLWGFMILIGIIYATLTGNLSDVTNAALNSSKEAVTLCITMLGVMSLWVGIMRIAENCGIISGATRMLNPLLRFMFPKIPKGHKANEYISTNIIANVFGLGWAATPAGLKAMEEMGELNHHHPTASKDMCTFLILNVSSFQLIPVNMIAYRSQYGSANPASILGPAMIATFFSTLAGILFAKVMYLLPEKNLSTTYKNSSIHKKKKGGIF